VARSLACDLRALAETFAAASRVGFVNGRTAMADDENFSKEDERDFVGTLTELDDGMLLGKLNQSLREVVRAAEQSGGKGTITLKIDVKTIGEGQIGLDPTITTKIPRRKPQGARFWADKDGDLHRSNPKQVKLKGLDGNVTPMKKAAIEAGRQIAEAKSRLVDVLGLPVVIAPNDQAASVVTAAIELADKRAETPRRRGGTSKHSDLSSLIAHAIRHKDADSVAFADQGSGEILVIYDYNRAGPPTPIASAQAGGSGSPRWGIHHATFTAPPSTEWKKWFGVHNVPMKQVQFGDFLEDNMDDLAGPESVNGIQDVPSPAKLLDVARSLVVMKGGRFESKINRDTGERTLVNTDEHGDTSTKVPNRFLIGIPIYEGGDVYEVECRLRFELGGGGVSFTVAIKDHEKLLRKAFADSWMKVRDGASLPVFLGKPE
jgi:uncharacterized protein YfdQ (DUF2303 family)